MSISYNELLNLSNVNIIDIRDNYSYNMGHLLGSINIPYEVLSLLYYKYLDKDDIYYIYCSEGMKSMNLSQKLNMLGYKCYSIEGGYNSFKNRL